jgi:isocitrate dehydrogenase
MELITKSGQTIVLKPKVALQDGEIIDSMFMSRKALLDFYEQQIEDAKNTGVLFSLHVKATMMKVSHPIVFGHCVRTFYKEAFEKHGALFDSLGVNVNNGMADLYNKIATLPASQREEIMRDIHACQEHRPALAMVDSAKGITNFHSPNDVIVDASMPAMIRAGGKMYGADGRLKEVKAVIPESTFARIYQEIINFCKWHGAFDPKTMGTVPNVGLMAQQAEEYGSHDKTFEIRKTAWPTSPTSPPAKCCCRRTSRRATSGACARSRTRRSATGSSWPSPAPATPACRPCSGSTRTVRTRMN